MTEQEQSAEQIFGAALDLPPEQRSAYLVRACRESPELRTLLEQLLVDYKRMGAFLDDPALSSAPAFTSATDSIGLPNGHTLGRYTILEPLGSGGMGTVYRARDERLEREVAIKILSPGLLEDEETRRRFRREALALAKLGHAHIAAIHDVGEHDGIDFIVMECVPGQTLAAAIRSGPLSVRDATSIALQIAEALEEAHEQGVVHRDLKPANVIITPKRQVKVLDFGIAKLLAPRPDATASIETAFLVGTPLYMSPEQAEARPVDGRTDLWSLGVLYAEALTGKNPFAASGTIAVLNRIVHEAPTPLHDLRPDVGSEPERIVNRALQKDLPARYQTAAEMAADFSSLLASFTATTTVPQHQHRSRRSLFAIIAPVLAAIIAFAVWLFHRSSMERWAREDALPQMQALVSKNQTVAAFTLWQKAHSICQTTINSSASLTRTQLRPRSTPRHPRRMSKFSTTRPPTRSGTTSAPHPLTPFESPRATCAGRSQNPAPARL